VAWGAPAARPGARNISWLTYKLLPCPANWVKMGSCTRPIHRNAIAFNTVFKSAPRALLLVGRVALFAGRLAAEETTGAVNLAPVATASVSLCLGDTSGGGAERCFTPHNSRGQPARFLWQLADATGARFTATQCFLSGQAPRQTRPPRPTSNRRACPDLNRVESDRVR